MKFGHMVLEICKWRDRQIYRQTDMLMAIRALILLKTLALYKPFTYLLTFHPYRGRSIDQLLMMMK